MSSRLTKVGEVFQSLLESLFSFNKKADTKLPKSSINTSVLEDKTPAEESAILTNLPKKETIPPIVSVVPKWHPPIREDKFRPTQKFLNPDPIYEITGHHPGTDYGTQGEDNVSLYFCADGEVIESGFHKVFRNYFFYYVPEADRTFIYFHLRDVAPAKGMYKAGQQCGIVGETGLSIGIHLHLECMRGRKTSSDRAHLYTSKEALTIAAEDPDIFIRSRLL